MTTKTQITQEQAQQIDRQCQAGERDSSYIAVLNPIAIKELREFLDLHGLDLYYFEEWKSDASKRHTFKEDFYLEIFSETRGRSIAFELTHSDFDYYAVL